jgi:hypothetical protein
LEVAIREDRELIEAIMGADRMDASEVAGDHALEGAGANSAVGEGGNGTPAAEAMTVSGVWDDSGAAAVFAERTPAVAVAVSNRIGTTGADGAGHVA